VTLGYEMKKLIKKYGLFDGKDGLERVVMGTSSKRRIYIYKITPKYLGVSCGQTKLKNQLKFVNKRSANYIFKMLTEMIRTNLRPAYL